jgi:hypothetical protein
MVQILIISFSLIVLQIFRIKLENSKFTFTFASLTLLLSSVGYLPAGRQGAADG